MWEEIEEGHYGVRRAPSFKGIRDPRVRVILKMVCLALNGPKTGSGKARHQELFLLGCISRSYVVNVPHFWANWMATSMKGVKKGIVVSGGQYVTLLGWSFGSDVRRYLGVVLSYFRGCHF